MHFTRRDFLTGASALGVASLLGYTGTVAAEPPPEITKVQLVHAPAICLAPQYLVEELLHLEGFSEVRYVDITTDRLSDLVAIGQADATMVAAPELVYSLGEGKSLLALGGIHAGCYELFGNERVQAIRDLRQRRVVITKFGAPDHVLVASMLAYVGIDPRRDIEWVLGVTETDSMRLFREGKADAIMGFAPQPQELRAENIGHVIVNTAQDRPWSQYFCCMLTANKDFVAKHPVAIKRILRAFLRAADICAQEPERVAGYLAAKGFEPRYEIGLKVLRDVPYARWREQDPEDTLRFYALRLHEVRMIRLTPQELIAQGADWRFLNELKRELKA